MRSIAPSSENFVVNESIFSVFQSVLVKPFWGKVSGNPEVTYAICQICRIFVILVGSKIGFQKFTEIRNKNILTVLTVIGSSRDVGS